MDETQQQQIASDVSATARSVTIIAVIVIAFAALTVIGAAVTVIMVMHGSSPAAAPPSCSPYAVMGTC